jgi:DNA-binding protein HU-beta
VTKADLVDHVAAEAQLTKREAEAAVEAVLGTITGALHRGSEVTLSGFGKFHVAERGARQGRHPRTGAPLHIPASRTPRFAPGARLKAAVRR